MTDAALLRRTTGDWRSLDALLQHLAGRPVASFLFPHGSSQESASIFRRSYPDYLAAVIASADAACRNELNLLGRDFQFPNGIDWLRDPVTNWRWPLKHRSRMSLYIGPDRPVDLIVYWELNRHQHFITLGIAYWLTGDERYTEAFISQLRNWIDSNPLQQGMNWYYGLEISIRLLAWTAAFQFFRASSKFRKEVGAAFLKSLWQQTDFLSRHLQTQRSKHSVPNNHLIAELTGLAIVGAAFPEFRDATLWRDAGLHLLEEQAKAQTYADGVNKEQATGYHRFIAELLLLTVSRSRQGALPPVPVLENTLEGMLDYIHFSLSPAGTGPMWGDTDFGRALGLGLTKDFWDFRPLLSAGAVLFGRADWKSAAVRFDEEAFWLLGHAGLARWKGLDSRPSKYKSKAFPDAGQYVLRDSWAANGDIAWFRCGRFGLGGDGQCAHAHCDLLSVVLWSGGRPLLVDSGTYLYHDALRDHFRLVGAHNTAKLDGLEQAAPLPHFNWKRIPEAYCTGWTGTSVKGSLRLSPTAEFVRELSRAGSGSWEILDVFNGQGRHRIEWSFHFAPGLDLKLQGAARRLVVIQPGQPIVEVDIPGSDVACRTRMAWYSYQYGVKQPNGELYAWWDGELFDSGVSFLWRFKRADG